MNSQQQPADDQELSQSTVFDVLSSQRRRWALQLLHEAGGTLELSTLTERIAALEADVPVDQLQSQARKRVYVSLYQTHIPKLEDVGLVRYDPETGLITRTDAASAVDPYLTTGVSDRNWLSYYLFLAMFGVGIITAAQLVETVTPTAGAVLLIASLFVVSLFHLRSREQTDQTLHGRLPERASEED